MPASPIRLGLDTATPFLALALWSPEEGVLAARRPRVGRDHAARLLTELDALLEEAGAARDALGAVTVGVGPGSYTGLRVGIASARAFGRAWAVPVGGASTLAQIAWGALAEGESGAAVLDARRGNVYGAIYRREGGTLRELAPVAKASREAWRARLEEAAPGGRWLEDLAPDAAWAASRAPAAAPAEAVYL